MEGLLFLFFFGGGITVLIPLCNIIPKGGYYYRCEWWCGKNGTCFVFKYLNGGGVTILKKLMYTL